MVKYQQSKMDKRAEESLCICCGERKKSSVDRTAKTVAWKLSCDVMKWSTEDILHMHG